MFPKSVHWRMRLKVVLHLVYSTANLNVKYNILIDSALNIVEQSPIVGKSGFLIIWFTDALGYRQMLTITFP